MGVRTRFVNFGLVTALAAGCAPSEGGLALDASALAWAHEQIWLRLRPATPAA
jgi:hypothetical protein